MASQWQIHKGAGACGKCERVFVENEVLFSLLQINDQGIDRGDLCSSCFKPAEQDRSLFWWRTQHSESASGLKLDLDSLLALLGSLDEAKDDGKLDFRFLLSLLLVRHRKLRLATVIKRGKKEYLSLKKVRSKTSFEVEVRELNDERREMLSRALAGLMDPTLEVDLDQALDPTPEV